MAKKHAAINSPRRKEKERKELTFIQIFFFIFIFFFFKLLNFVLGYKQLTNNVVIISSEERLEILNSQVLC